jgi:hypothetical protein
MDRFDKEILFGAENRKFQFERLRNMNGVKFFVTTVNEKGKPISFSMTQSREGNWKLFPGSLMWLYEIESQLSDAIVDTRLL